MRLKLCGTTVTTGVQQLSCSGVEIFFFSLLSPTTKVTWTHATEL